MMTLYLVINANEVYISGYSIDWVIDSESGKCEKNEFFLQKKLRFFSYVFLVC